MTINVATLSAVHSRSEVCATRKGSTLPQGGGTEADSLATQATEKLWDRLLLTGSILTQLSSGSTQNYFCSSPFSFIQLRIDHGLYVRNYTRLSGQSFMFLTWRNAHYFCFSPSSLGHLHILLFHFNADHDTKLKCWHVFRRALSLHWPNNLYFYSPLKAYKQILFGPQNNTTGCGNF